MHLRGGTRLFISEKGCKDCSRATIPPTRCSLQTRGRITTIIIRLMPCKLSGRERPFAWFYAHFSADADLRRRAAIITIMRRNDLVGFNEIFLGVPCRGNYINNHKTYQSNSRQTQALRMQSQI